MAGDGSKGVEARVEAPSESMRMDGAGPGRRHRELFG